MIDLDDRLRRDLHEAVASVVPSDALPGRVNERIVVHERRARRTRTALVGVLAAFVVSVGAVAALSGRSGPTQQQTAATPRTGASGWQAVALAPIGPRFQHLQVWTGAEVVVFGGFGMAGDPAAGGAAYDPAAGSWRPIAPPPGDLTIAAWTGSEILALATDGSLWSYDPAGDAWSERAPSRYREVAGTTAVAAWTGSELVVAYSAAAGDGRLPGDSAAFDPATGTWRTLPGAPFDITFADAVWTGQQLIVAGDAGASGRSNPHLELWALDPATGEWTELPGPPLLDAARRSHGFAVWTGTELVVGGGSAVIAERPMVDVAAFDPAARTWRSLPPAPVPVAGLARYGETWTGSEVLVWAATDGPQPNRGQVLLLDPVTGSWRVAGPPPEGGHTDAPATWTGAELIVWSGEVTATDTDPGACCRPSAAGSAFTP